jgi:alpha-L-fucosidase 2
VHQWLVIAPANSPENHFLMANGAVACICMGPAVLQQQVRYLFGACIDSSKLLGIDEDFRQELASKRARLAPTQVGSDGRIMEWLNEYREPEPHHRHVSHLWGMYPGDEISRCTTPQLAQAARKSLEVRCGMPTMAPGTGGVGWSLAHKAALWARLGDGNTAWLLVRSALQPASEMGLRYDGGAVCIPTCLMPARLFKLTETLASRQPSPKCCSRAKKASLICCLLCQTCGRKEAFPACALVEGTRLP